MMPNPLIVAPFLMITGIALVWSPLPKWMIWLQSSAFIYLGTVHALLGIFELPEDEHSRLLRFGLIVLSSVNILCLASFKYAGCKVWRAPWKLP